MKMTESPRAASRGVAPQASRQSFTASALTRKGGMVRPSERLIVFRLATFANFKLGPFFLGQIVTYFNCDQDEDVDGARDLL